MRPSDGRAAAIPGPWAEQAACRSRSTAVFFPPGEDNGTRPLSDAVYAAARAICGGCPVRVECLAFALETNQSWGCWAGRTPAQLRDLRRRRRPMAVAS